MSRRVAEQDLLQEAADIFAKFDALCTATHMILTGEEVCVDDLRKVVRDVVHVRMDQINMETDEWKDRAKAAGHALKEEDDT